MGEAMEECLGGTMMYGPSIMVSDRDGEPRSLHARDRSALGLAEPPPCRVQQESPSSTKTIPGPQKKISWACKDGNKMVALF
jgi:hypothetical protein